MTNLKHICFIWSIYVDSNVRVNLTIFARSTKETSHHGCCMNQLLFVQQLCSQLFDFWSFICCAYINVVQRGLQKCVQTGQSIIIFHTEHKVGLEQFIKCNQGCTWLTWKKLSIQDYVEGFVCAFEVPEARRYGWGFPSVVMMWSSKLWQDWNTKTSISI